MRASELLIVSTLVVPLFSQVGFGGSSSGSSSSSSGSKSGGSSSSSSGSSVQPGDTDTRFFGITSGNEGIDGGILGFGAGALAATLLQPVLSGGGGGGCGRRKRQADGEQRFFLPSGGSCTCGRKKRQAPGENDVNKKFFNIGGLFGGGNSNNNHCGSCCFNNNNNGGGFNNGGSFNNNNNNQCQCNNNLTWRDQNGNTHGACQRSDGTGLWCYTTGWNNNGCGDLRSSKRHPNNPWSYRACNYNGK